MNQDLHGFAGRLYVQVKIEIARLIRPVSPQRLLIRQVGLGSRTRWYRTSRQVGV